MNYMALLAALLASAGASPDIQDATGIAGRDTLAPKKTYAPSPLYPYDAAEARVSAWLLIELTVGEDGRASELKIIRGHPLFDRVALDTLKNWRYEPRVVDGSPQRVRVLEPVGFFTGESDAENTWKEVASARSAPIEARLWAISGLGNLSPKRKEGAAKALQALVGDQDERVATAARAALAGLNGTSK
jgi:TonB family protein